MRLIDETLDAWREGERLLDDLPQVHADYDTARFAVATLKTVYQQLTDVDTPAEAEEATVRRTVAAMRRVLDQVRRRYNAGSG